MYVDLTWVVDSYEGRFRRAVLTPISQRTHKHPHPQWFDSLIPPPPTPYDWINVKKVLLDQFIQAPIFTVVIFAFLDVLEGKNWEGIKAQVKRDFWCVACGCLMDDRAAR